VKINDYVWGEYPHEFDLIRIPNEKKAPQLLMWNAANKKWEGWETDVTGASKPLTDVTVPTGQGFWYHRVSDEFVIKLPVSKPKND
jgi:hypothetical protein